MAKKKRWDRMPLPGLLDALSARDATVARMDEVPPSHPRFRASTAQGKFINGPLYYEWTLEK